ncbi:DUF6326 family protein [Aquipuribacter sp. SD81]|uniref:DUF6326 family protein n=1 Tax=Aquipuribacter sp. SD81 TaxID=3127703 RepID=UPI003017510A
MSTRQTDVRALDDQRVPVRAVLAALWTGVMLLYVYVDILAFYRPGTVEDILDGRVWELAITQTWATTALALMALPILMVVLSVTLPARAGRVVNLVVAALQLPFAAFNVVGETWVWFYGLGFALEAVLLVLVLRYAWAWPRTGAPATAAASRAGVPA